MVNNNNFTEATKKTTNETRDKQTRKRYQNENDLTEATKKKKQKHEIN